MDPSQAVITPWEQYGIIGSVVVALGAAVVFLIQWIRSLVSKNTERLEAEIAAKDAAYERLVESTRKRTKEEA